MEQNRQFVDSEFVKLSDEPILNANFIKLTLCIPSSISISKTPAMASGNTRPVAILVESKEPFYC